MALIFRPILFYLSIFLFLFIVIVCAADFFNGVFYNNRKILLIINGKVKQYSIFILNTFTKIVFVVVLGLLFSSVLNNVNHGISAKKELSVWKKTAPYFSFYFGNYELPTDTRGMPDVDKINIQFKPVAEWLMAQKDVIVSGYLGTFDDSAQEGNLNDTYINSRYLEENRVLDEQGKRIEVSPREANPVILVPEAEKSQEKMIKRDYFTDIPNATKINIIYYPKEQRFFTYNPGLLDFQNYSGSVTGVHFVVINPTNVETSPHEDIGGLYSSIASQKGFLIPEQLLPSFKKKMAEVGLSGTIGSYVRGEVVAASYIEHINGQIMSGLIVGGILLILIITLTSLSNQIYFSNMRRENSIKYINGWYFLEINQLWFVLTLGETFVMLLLFMLFRIPVLLMFGLLALVLILSLGVLSYQ